MLVKLMLLLLELAWRLLPNLGELVVLYLVFLVFLVEEPQDLAKVL